MEMKKYRLGEICSIIPGFAFKAEDFDKGDNIVIKITDIQPPYINIENAHKVNTIPGDKRTLLLKDDFVMAMTGATIGKIGRLNRSVPNVYINQRVCKFIVKDGFSKDFLYYVLIQPVFRKFIFQNVDSSSAQPNIGHPTIYNFEFQYPPYDSQIRIAKVLSSLDSKIALNHRINAKLEQIAKRLYDYWFVQFDFPNAEGKPYKSSGGAMVYNSVLKREIPVGWEIFPISKILDKYPTTKKYSKAEFLKEGKFPIVDQDSSSFIAGYTNENDNTLKRFPAVLFGDHSTCVKFLNFEFCRGADGTQILYSNDERISQYYLYHTVKELHIPNPGYSRHFKYLKELPIIIPPLELAKAFKNIVYPNYQKQTNCTNQIVKLTALRDKLLPLLMNGQVTVK